MDLKKYWSAPLETIHLSQAYSRNYCRYGKNLTFMIYNKKVGDICSKSTRAKISITVNSINVRNENFERLNLLIFTSCKNILFITSLQNYQQDN